MDLHTFHDTATLERAYAESSIFELISGWIAAHACIDAIGQLVARGLTERNAQKLVGEINVGVGTMMLEFRRRAITPPDINIRPIGVPPAGEA